MHAVTTTKLALQDFIAQVECPGALPEGSVSELLALAVAQPLVLETSLRFECHHLHALIFALPSATSKRLSSLATARPKPYNEESVDLRTRTTYLAWSDGLHEVRVDTCLLRSFASVTPPGFFAIFLSDEHATVALNRFDEEGILDFMTDVQCHAISSGLNYDPWRIYSAKEMELVKGAPDVATSGVDTHRVLHFSTDRR